MPKKRNSEGRRQNSLDRLGTDNPCCRCCGNTDPRCLELHHLAGQNFGEDQVIECRNCHRILSDDQTDHPDPLGNEPPDLLEHLAHFLLGLGDFFALLAIKLKEFGSQLLDRLANAAETIGGAS
jgi:hypothetical protein